MFKLVEKKEEEPLAAHLKKIVDYLMEPLTYLEIGINNSNESMI